MNGLMTFNLGGGPCLRWKLVAAVKLQLGWPGFIAPYQTRYLTKVVTISVTPSFGYGTSLQGGTSVSSSSFTINRHTLDSLLGQPGGSASQQTVISGGGASADFPYGATLTEGGDFHETWAVSETHFKHFADNGYNVIITEVQLSNQYDIGTLSGDADALLTAADVTDQPWNTWRSVGDLIPPIVFIDIPNTALPEQFRNASQSNSGPAEMAGLNSAAWYCYVYGSVSEVQWLPNGYMKCIGYVAMAGNYCLKTFTIDPQFDILNETCLSGRGSCADTFRVSPPPLSPGQNAYVLLTPNCQCGGG